MGRVPQPTPAAGATGAAPTFRTEGCGCSASACATNPRSSEARIRSARISATEVLVMLPRGQSSQEGNVSRHLLTRRYGEPQVLPIGRTEGLPDDLGSPKRRTLGMRGCGGCGPRGIRKRDPLPQLVSRGGAARGLNMDDRGQPGARSPPPRSAHRRTQQATRLVPAIENPTLVDNAALRAQISKLSESRRPNGARGGCSLTVRVRSVDTA